MPAKRVTAKIAVHHHDPHTVQELAARSGYSIPTVKLYINELRADKRCYIAKWLVSGMNMVPVYARGRKEDAPKPGKATKAQIREECHRSRIVAELARPPFRDPFIAQFFGEYQGVAA